MYIKGLYELKLSVQALEDKLNKISKEIENTDVKDEIERICLKHFKENTNEFINCVETYEFEMKDVE